LPKLPAHIRAGIRKNPSTGRSGQLRRIVLSLK
jgi:hypothetical protein